MTANAEPTPDHAATSADEVTDPLESPQATSDATDDAPMTDATDAPDAAHATHATETPDAPEDAATSEAADTAVVDAADVVETSDATASSVEAQAPASVTDAEAEPAGTPDEADTPAQADGAAADASAVAGASAVADASAASAADDASAADATAAADQAPAADEPAEASDAVAAGEARSVEEAPAAYAAPAVPTPAAVPTPSPRPMPRPGAPRATVPVVPAAPAVEAVPAESSQAWGRVDDDGTVSVREGDTWRVVGEYPDGTREEALAYFERKYTDLASEVTLLEVRQRSGGASASDLRSTAKTIQGKLAGAAAVGDLARLEARVHALTESLEAESESEAAAAREAVAEAARQRTALVEKVEALAAKDPRSIQWKQTSAELSSLFDEWQSQQQNGPRLSKSTGQQLWKRFRDARATLDKHRREFFAELDEEHKAVRDRKLRLVEKAEGLAPKGEDGIGAYRELLEQWKTAGRAGKKADDSLWARFKAAGDALYSARGEREAADAEASREKIEAKRELLAEARTVADETDVAKARAQLTGIQRRWDEIGRIFPRDKERTLDDELRKIEQAVRGREDVEWKRNNPETKARTNDMTRQLTDAIEKLEQEVAAAKKAGNDKAAAAAAEALEARKAWLKAVGG